MVGVLKTSKKETTIKKMTKSYLEKLQSIEHSEGNILKIIPPAIKLSKEMFKEIRADAFVA